MCIFVRCTSIDTCIATNLTTQSIENPIHINQNELNGSFSKSLVTFLPTWAQIQGLLAACLVFLASSLDKSNSIKHFPLSFIRLIKGFMTLNFKNS